VAALAAGGPAFTQLPSSTHADAGFEVHPDWAHIQVERFCNPAGAPAPIRQDMATKTPTPVAKADLGAGATAPLSTKAQPPFGGVPA
jgi:hypothetical protein